MRQTATLRPAPSLITSIVLPSIFMPIFLRRGFDRPTPSTPTGSRLVTLILPSTPLESADDEDAHSKNEGQL